MPALESWPGAPSVVIPVRSSSLNGLLTWCSSSPRPRASPWRTADAPGLV